MGGCACVYCHQGTLECLVGVQCRAVCVCACVCVYVRACVCVCVCDLYTQYICRSLTDSSIKHSDNKRYYVLLTEYLLGSC